MKVIFGLGNPGKPYLKTKHNVGKIFIQQIVTKNNNHIIEKPKYTQYQLNDKLIACLSNTFMNSSGEAVKAFLKNNSSIKVENILLVHDDLEHKIGTVRIKHSGSAEGNNGVKSVISHLKTDQIKRLKFGIGRPISRDPVDVSRYVLAKFSTDEQQLLHEAFRKALTLLKQQQYL